MGFLAPFLIAALLQSTKTLLAPTLCKLINVLKRLRSMIVHRWAYYTRSGQSRLKEALCFPHKFVDIKGTIEVSAPICNLAVLDSCFIVHVATLKLLPP